jgi:hypothetical protein
MRPYRYIIAMFIAPCLVSGARACDQARRFMLALVGTHFAAIAVHEGRGFAVTGGSD